MIIAASPMSFSYQDVVRRTSKNLFFTRMNNLINWSMIDEEIKKRYHPGKNGTGQSAYSGLLLYKMLLTDY